MSSSSTEQLPSAAGENDVTPVLSISALRKEYGPVVALRAATLDLLPGEIHALVGENGSGKSTLVGCVSGTVEPTSGSVVIGGVPVTKASPGAAARLGAVTVFQDGTMLPELTVGQNLYVGTRADLRPAYRDIDAWGAQVMQSMGITGISPQTRTIDVAPGDRQLIEIARAMSMKPKLLMLDEATSALDSSGVDRVMALIVRAAEAGTAVLFVTHRLGEVFRVAQRISILRDGGWQGTMPAEGVTAHQLVNLMAGTSVEMEFPHRPGVPADAPTVLSAESLACDGVLGVDLAVKAGEIVGIAGADGNGQGQLLAALGAVTPLSGQLSVDGKRVASPSAASGNGVVYLSGDRKKESLFQGLSVRENLNVGVLPRLARAGFLPRAAESANVAEAIATFGIRVGNPSQPVSSLSGGNQQKVAISRALSANPKVLLIDEPTRGVDVRSRMDIYAMLREAANAGLAVVAVSSDAAELAGICDRIVVMSRGRIITQMPGSEATEDRIVEAFAVGSHASDAEPLADSSENDAPPVRLAHHLRHLVSGAQDFVRMAVLVLVLLGLFLFARHENAAFGSQQNITNVLLLALPIAAVAVAEFSVLLIGGIDIAVGATMSLSVVAMSFLVTSGSVAQVLLVGAAVAVVVGAAVGGLNAVLIEGTKVAPVIATIATMGIAGGLALILRPTAGGMVSLNLMTAFNAKAGPVPVALLVLIALMIVGDWMLWKSGPGVRVRAVGLHPAFAQRLGIPVARVRFGAYVAAGVLSGLAGLILASSVGTGDPNSGNGFTLLAIAAPVLGGASLLGGRGSLFGCLLGAMVLAMANSIVPMLGISDAWSFMIVGILSILALVAYSSRGHGIVSVTSIVKRVRAA